MTTMNGKIYTYLGFAIKMGRAKLGVGAVEFTKGKIPLMLLCSTASENTQKDAHSLARRHGSTLILVKSPTLEELTNKKNCKLAAVLDESLANAIKTNVDDNFLFLEA